MESIVYEIKIWDKNCVEEWAKFSNIKAAVLQEWVLKNSLSILKDEGVGQ